MSTLHQRAKKGAHEGLGSSQEPEGSLTAISEFLFFQAENVPPHCLLLFVDEGRTTRPIRPSNPPAVSCVAPGLKTMSFSQIAGDAAECPLSLFANPGRNRASRKRSFFETTRAPLALDQRAARQPSFHDLGRSRSGLGRAVL